MTAPGGTTIRDALARLSSTPFLGGYGEKFLYAPALVLDTLLEGLRQAINDRMPGRASADALPVIGDNRLIDQGVGEPAASYATRLQQSFDTWATAGSAWSILANVIAYVAGGTANILPQSPRARHVNAIGIWDSMGDIFSGSPHPLTGTPTWRLYPPPNNWNWDGVLTNFWRFWVILYSGTNLVGSVTAASGTPIQLTVAAHGLLTGAVVWADGINGNLPANGKFTITKVDANNFTLNGTTSGGAYTSGGTVLNVPVSPFTICTPSPAWGCNGVQWGDGHAWGLSGGSQMWAGLTKIITRFNRGGSFCQWLIVALDPSWYVPTNSVGANSPDGTWGPWYKQVGYTNVPTRSGLSRFVTGGT